MNGERLKALVLADNESHRDLITIILKEFCDIQTAPLPSTPEAARPDFAVLGPFRITTPEGARQLSDEIHQVLGEITVPILLLYQDSQNLEVTAQAVGTNEFLYWKGDLDLLQEKVLTLLESTQTDSQISKQR
jgi:hypothetical protein